MQLGGTHQQDFLLQILLSPVLNSPNLGRGRLTWKLILVIVLVSWLGTSSLPLGLSIFFPTTTEIQMPSGGQACVCQIDSFEGSHRDEAEGQHMTMKVAGLPTRVWVPLYLG